MSNVIVVPVSPEHEAALAAYEPPSAAAEVTVRTVLAVIRRGGKDVVLSTRQGKLLLEAGLLVPEITQALEDEEAGRAEQGPERRARETVRQSRSLGFSG